MHEPDVLSPLRNPAARVLDLITSANESSAEDLTTEVWERIFGISGDSERESRREVARCLVHIDDEIRLAAAMLRERKYPEVMYKKQFHQLRRVSDVGTILSKLGGRVESD